MSRRLVEGKVPALLFLLLLSFLKCKPSPAFAPSTRPLRASPAQSLPRTSLPRFSLLHTNGVSKFRRNQRPPGSLSLANYPAEPLLRAAGCLSFSALLGSWMDRRVIPNSGILVALVTSAACSAFKLAPSMHFLYDLCWTTFLPGSLALLLLAMKETDVKETPYSSSSNDSVLTIVRRMALPFGIV